MNAHNDVKERQIPFKAPMVRAILDGSKTQTRRIVKMKPWHQIEERDDGTPWPWMYDGERNADYWLSCPYGQPGDRLWVRESFWGCDLPGYGDTPCVVYDDEWYGKEYRPKQERPWARKFGRIPSIHMPRDCSRIDLEITGVRVERLTDISQVDALSEGISSIRTKEWDLRHFRQWRTLFDAACEAGKKPPLGPTPTRSFQALWESINGPGSWDANPWVWVIEFKVVKP